MITSKELTAVELSPTKKDFYQIWNELLDVASKLSERWDPTSTNESDPGIVLLKVLTAVADKLNYTIDSNILEAFMPSAAQQESMRKLCDMLGYNMKYYNSATTSVKITYNESNHDIIPSNTIICIDKFTNIKDADGTINYVTIDNAYLSTNATSITVKCIEGDIVECETDDDNIISILQLDDNNRYYLPETQIAENGIFITNISDLNESNEWERVESLNIQPTGKPCYKFGYDSKENLPYIQFPDDISTIIEDGLRIRYLRTHGLNGNVSVNTLTKMEAPYSWSLNTDTSSAASAYDYYNTENYTVTNIAASSDGTNIETLNNAYNNYKKIIGTFDTLVTCRDYMNKIYQMTVDDNSNLNLVSNVIVSDIRDDINKSITICSFTDRGIEYKNMARPVYLEDAEPILESVYNALDPNSDPDEYLGKLYRVTDDNNNTKFYARCIYDGTTIIKVAVNTTALTHFDLVIYPFKNIYNLNTKPEFIKSFKYDDANFLEILTNLEKNKTIAHNIISPDKYDIACIKNYLRLKASINTIRKVTSIEQASILGNVYSALYENFNMRRVDFGEDIPYDSIYDVIKNADTRIKSITLEEPTIVTKYCTVSGGEFVTSAGVSAAAKTPYHTTGDSYYNQLVLNNVLAGRVPLFNYDTNFKPDYTEVPYPTQIVDGEPKSYSLVYPDDNKKIYKLKTEFLINQYSKDVTLKENEVVQFRLPNLKTIKTFPAYVNYYLHLNVDNTANKAIPATMQSLDTFIRRQLSWDQVLNEAPFNSSINTIAVTDKTDFEQKINKYVYLFTYANGIYTEVNEWNDEWATEMPTFYYSTYTEWTKENVATWHNWIINRAGNKVDVEDELYPAAATDSRDGLYVVYSTEMTRSIGELVDISHTKYQKLDRIQNVTAPNWLTVYYVARLWSSDKISSEYEAAKYLHTQDGLGQNSDYVGIYANEEYKLKTGEYLLINYTHSTSTDGVEEKTKINLCYTDTIIKPNFDLIDSELYNDLHSWNKTDGYDFTEFGYTKNKIAGLFTLSSDQQIEIRDFVKVELDEPTTNIYWRRNEETPDTNGKIIFDFDERPIYFTDSSYTTTTETKTNYVIYTAYTLKAGEYFYYTDANKTDMAYYGSGTVITRTLNTPTIFKYSRDNDITTDDIASRGLTAAIPWRNYDFSESGNKDKKLSICEYQYVNLLAQDVLHNVQAANSTAEINEEYLSNADVEIDIDNYPKPIKYASYKVNGGEGELPRVDLKDDNGQPILWEVRSKLELNVGPSTAQTIYNRQTGTATDTDNDTTLAYAVDKITLYTKQNIGDAFTEIELVPFVDTPLTIKTNKAIQSSANESLDVTTKVYDEDGNITEVKPDLQIKVLALTDIRDDSDNPLTLNNFGDTFTKISFTDTNTYRTAAYTTLNNIIPEKDFGLITIYNKKVSTDSSAAIRVVKSTASAETPTAPGIFNLDSWTNSTATETFEGTMTEEAYNAAVDSSIPLYTRTSETVATMPTDIVPGVYRIVAVETVVPAVPCEAALTADTAIDSEKTYYTRSAEDDGTPGYLVDEDGYTYTAVSEPILDNIGTYYEVSVEGSDAATTITGYTVYTYTKVSSTDTYSASTTYYQLTLNTTTNSWWNGIATSVNPKGYGKIATKTMWAVVDNVFTKDIGQALFDQWKENDILYYVSDSTASDTKPSTPAALKSFDYNATTRQYTTYTYTKIDSTSETEYDPTVLYGTLLDVGGTSTLYYLRDGLNTIKFDKSCKLEIYPDEDNEDIIIFGQLDLIALDTATSNNVINPKLAYKITDPETYDTVTEQILADINKLDTLHAFYYNIVVPAASDIDMNENDSDDTLESPENWYDYNNINNKFVISEIDADYLKDHVVVAKASRLS